MVTVKLLVLASVVDAFTMPDIGPDVTPPALDSCAVEVFPPAVISNVVTSPSGSMKLNVKDIVVAPPPALIFADVGV